MKERKFNIKQLEAINSPINKDVLVSASAGSGKTEILSQKIFKVLEKDKVSPEEILVLTFTNKAAYEMKQRIIKTIKDNSSDKTLSSRLLSSHIQTFDAYSMYLVKTFSSYLNIPSNIQIIDSEQISLLKNQILDEYILECLTNNEARMKSLVSKQDSFGSSLTKDLIIEIYDKFYSLSSDDQELVKIISLNSNNQFYTNKFKEYLNSYVTSNYLYPLVVFCYVNTTSDDISNYSSTINLFLKKFNKLSDDELYSYCKDILLSNSWANSLRNAYITIIDSIRNEKYDLLTENLISSLSSLRSKEKNELVIKQVLGEEYPKTYLYLYNLVSDGIKSQLHTLSLVKDDIKYIFEICSMLKEKIDEYKKFSNSYEYKDISSFALKLFDIDEVRDILENKFKFIIVDEYQDTNDEQELFISKQAKKAHLFLVGDAKQSIYRFRGSKVELFNYRRESLHKNGLVIDMNYNYRSIEKVINDINLIFTNYMTKNKGGVDYSLEEEKLRYDFDTDLYNKEKISKDTSNHGINIINYKNNGNYSTNINEALTIIHDIKEKVESKYEIYTKEGLRPCKYSDFAIIVRRKRSFNDYVTIFEEHNIPLENQVEVDLKDMDVFLLIKSLLNLLAIRLNLISGNELHYFVSIARSYIYGNCSYFTDSKIHEIIFDKKKDNNSKLYNESEIIQKIDKISKLYVDNPFIYVFNELIEEFGVLTKLNSIGSILDNVEKIYSLYNKLCFDISCGNNLVSFLDKLDKYNKYNLEITYSSDNSSSDSVKLMSLHGSKGLEFPIIYLPVSDNKVDVKKDKSSVVVSNKYGISIPNYYPYLDSTLTKSFLFSLYNDEFDYSSEESENARLYYVLFTRAKESIFIIGNNEKINKGIESLYTLLNYSNHNYVFNYELIKDIVDINILKDLNTEYKHVTNNLVTYEYNKQKYLNDVNNIKITSLFFNNKIDSLYSKKENIESDVYNMILQNILTNLDISKLSNEDKLYISSITSSRNILEGINNLFKDKKKRNKVNLISKYLLNKIYSVNNLFDIEYLDFNQKEVDISDLVLKNKTSEISFNPEISDIYITTDKDKASNKDIYFNKLVKKKASKELLSEEDISDVLSFGSDVHKVMELIDLKNKDISILNDLPPRLKFLKPKIEKFIKLDILKDLSKSKIYKEYEFYSHTNNSKGSIDLLIVNPKDAIIIDYKLKNIDDKEYSSQLNYYKEEVSRLFNIKNIKCYLYSIMDSTLKEI